MYHRSAKKSRALQSMRLPDQRRGLINWLQGNCPILGQVFLQSPRKGTEKLFFRTEIVDGLTGLVPV